MNPGNDRHTPAEANTCKTCKWHQKVPLDRYPRMGGYCKCEKITENGGQKYGKDELVYSYSEGGYFWTGDNFGCVHHANALNGGAAPAEPTDPNSKEGNP